VCCVLFFVSMLQRERCYYNMAPSTLTHNAGLSQSADDKEEAEESDSLFFTGEQHEVIRS